MVAQLGNAQASWIMPCSEHGTSPRGCSRDLLVECAIKAQGGEIKEVNYRRKCAGGILCNKWVWCGDFKPQTNTYK